MQANLQKLPLVLLGGRDQRSTTLPEAGRGKSVLLGYKALDLKYSGRVLIEELVLRFTDSGFFGPIFIAGPQQLYQTVFPPGTANIRLIDTDGGFGENLQAGVEAAREEFPDRSVAVATSDILPDPGELQELLTDFRNHSPCDFWMPEILRPQETAKLGESHWKPRYGIRPEGESEPVATLPGHLVIVNPSVLRLDLIYRVFDLAYQTRNRSHVHRRSLIVRGTLAALLQEDWRLMKSAQWPHVTWEMLSQGLALGAKLRRGNVGQQEMEDLLRRIWVCRHHRRQYPERRGRVAILEGLSLAKDIDTEEEARELFD